VRGAVDVVEVRESGKNYSMSLRVGATLVGMALVWTGLVIALGPVLVVAVTVLLAAVVIGAVVSIRRDRARTTPSSAKAHVDAVQEYRLTLWSTVLYVPLVPAFIAGYVYEFGLTAGAVLFALGWASLLIATTPAMLQNLKVRRERAYSAAQPEE
jgi:hypothetical protein